jgi:hypothetical protein
VVRLWRNRAVGSGLRRFCARVSLLAALGVLHASSSVRAEVPTPQLAKGLSGPVEATLGDVSEINLLLENAQPGWEPATLLRAASVGTVGPAVADANGRWHLTYTLPADRRPQVALIVLFDPKTGEVYQHRVDLVARAPLQLQSEPGVRVEVVVGKQRFGPVLTDRRGSATLEILVPPGVRVAHTEAVDGYENRDERELSLKPPTFRRQLMVCPTGTGFGLLWALDGDGHDAAPSQVRLEDAERRTPTLEPLGPGIYKISATDSSGHTRVSAGGLTVRSRAVGTTEVAECILRGPPGAPAARTLEPPALEARSKFSVHPTVRVGYLTNGAKIGGPWVSARGLADVSLFGAKFQIGPEIGYFSSDRQVALDGAESMALTVRGVPLLVAARYVQSGFGIDWGAGASLGTVLLSLHTDGDTLARVPAPLWWAVAASAGKRLGLLALEIEGGYARSVVREPTVSGNTAGLIVTAGVGLRF